MSTKKDSPLSVSSSRAERRSQPQQAALIARNKAWRRETLSETSLGGARVIETTEAIHVLLRHGPRYDIFPVTRIDAEAPADRDLRLLRVAQRFYTQVQPRWRKHEFTTDGGRLRIGGLHPQVGGKRLKGKVWTDAGAIEQQWVFAKPPPTKATPPAPPKQDLAHLISVIPVKSPAIFTTSQGVFLIRPLGERYELLERATTRPIDEMSFVGPGRDVRIIRRREGCLEAAVGLTSGRTNWKNLGKLTSTAPAVEATIIERAKTPDDRDLAERLDWIILPDDWVNTRFGNGRRQPVSSPSASRATKMSIERVRFLQSLKPVKWCEGSHLGNVVYSVALFPRVAIADCVDAGNAIYYVPSDSRLSWKSVLRHSKRDALKAGAGRIIHQGDWKSRVRDLLGR